MARDVNIEVLRLRKVQHTALILAVCALAIACMMMAMPGTQAQYASADNGRHVFVFSDTNDVAISVTETWNPSDGLGLRSGSTIVKQPVVKNQKGDVYMRGIIRISDESGRVLDPATDADRIALIMGTLYVDPQGVINAGSSYSKSALAALSVSGVSDLNGASAFDAPQWNQTMQAYTINYKTLFAKDQSASMFDKVVVPSDYSVADIMLMGKYTITVWAQAIQSAGFSDVSSALNALSNDAGAGAAEAGGASGGGASATELEA